MRICIDIDGTIAELRNKTNYYHELKPIEGAVESIKKLHEEGHYIILYTARNMETYMGNMGKILAFQGPVLFKWLEKYEIPYDEIYFGKPSADVYIDDKGLKFESWKNLKL